MRWETPGNSKALIMSTLAIRALLDFQSKNDLNLCQEFIWYNPAKCHYARPRVNIERSRAVSSTVLMVDGPAKT